MVGMATKRKAAEKFDNVGIEVGGKNVLAGQVVSLDLTRQTYFGIGPIWLTPICYHVKIPEGLSANEYGDLEKALSSGVLVKGKKYIAPATRDTALLKDYERLLASNDPTHDEGLLAKLRGAIFGRGQGGYTAQEIIFHLIKFERSYKDRKAIVDWLHNALPMCRGPEESFPEPDHDKQGLREIPNPDGPINNRA